MNLPIRCRSCGSEDTHLMGRGARGRSFAGMPLSPPRDGAWLYRCGRCDLLMRHPLLSPEEYVGLYAPTSGDHWTRSDLRPEQQRIRDHIRHVLPKGGRVLDVGCSSGDLLQALGDGFEKFGIEPSADARARAEALGIQVVCETVDGLARLPITVDVITAVDVIEHVPDPLAFLRGLARHLSPGGRIVISTGNHRALAWRLCGAGYYYSHLFEHVSFISDRWCAFVASQGFTVQVLERLFAHQAADHAPASVRLKKLAVLAAKWLPAWLERAIFLQLPTTARRLGPRLMLAEPGMFSDHVMVTFQPAQEKRGA